LCAGGKSRAVLPEIDKEDPGMKSHVITAPQQILQRNIPTIERQFDDAVAAKATVVDFVLSAVQIVDSAGLNWLLSCQGRLESMGMKLRMVDPSPLMADVLLATRLDTRFLVISAEDQSAPMPVGSGVARG
jgi:anti-anti-sigma regulatory factor